MAKIDPEQERRRLAEFYAGQLDGELRVTPVAQPCDPVQQIVFSETGSSVDTVLIDGRIVVERGRITAQMMALFAPEEETLVKKPPVWPLNRRNLDPERINATWGEV